MYCLRLTQLIALFYHSLGIKSSYRLVISLKTWVMTYNVGMRELAKNEDRKGLVNKALIRSEELAKQLKVVAHDYEHLDAVRKMVILLGQDENLTKREIFLLEIAALWHDLALNKVQDRSKHGERAAELFLKEFTGDEFFSNAEKDIVYFLIKYHDRARLVRKPETNKDLLKKLNILTDADTLDLLGERGCQRAKETSDANSWPDFDINNPKGVTYGYSAAQFDEGFDLKDKGFIQDAKEHTLVGQLNFQISCADNLFTKKAKEIGDPGVMYLKKKIQDLIGKN